MAQKLIITLSLAVIYCLPLNVFASTSDSTNIGISVVVKATQNCQFEFLPVNYSHPNQTHYSNCDFKSKNLQERADQTALRIDRKVISDTSNEKQVRVVMTSQ